MQLRNDLSKIFDMDLPSTITFDYPTPSALAKWIAQATMESQFTTVDPMDMSKQAPGKTETHLVQATQLQALEQVAEEVSAIVSSILGAHISSTEPLMAAGLDSLGKHSWGV